MNSNEADEAALFRWRNREFVLLGESRDGELMLVRGWLEGDSMHAVRRWTFDTPDRFLGQIRRLVRASEGSDRVALDAVEDARAWLKQFPGNDEGRPPLDAPSHPQ